MLRPLGRDAKVALLSPSGWGNLGDAAILESLLHALRLRAPQGSLVAFTLNAARTAREHSVAAHTLLGYSTPFYPMADVEPVADAAAPAEGAPAPGRGLRELLRSLPLRGGVRELAAAPLRAARDAPHLLRSLRLLRGAEAVVVAGGGQLDELFGGPWGQPYALLRYGLLARAAGARFLVLSVGTGSLARPTSRFFVRRALSLAEYRSFRDDGSRQLLGAPALTARDPTVPDLAYAVPAQPAPLPARGERLVVGISPMQYGLPGSWPKEDPDRYRRLVSGMGALARRLVALGHEAAIFTTDADPIATRDVLAAAEPLEPDARARLRVEPTPTLEALFRALARFDVVVAARLHGALLAHVALRPVLAIPHERKVAALMDEVGHGRYSLPLDDLDAGVALERLLELARGRAELSAQVAAAVSARRARVLAQYDEVFGPTPAA
jgi:polysaccharide pyruvyl transferase WcaK-like protein